MAVIDTTFLIALERGGPAVTRLQEVQDIAPPIRIPAVVWVEYLASLEPGRRRVAVRRLEPFCVFEPVDRTLADEAARLQHELARAGRRLSWTDLLVAATALHYGEPLITNDEAFRGLPGLEWHPH